MKRPLYAALEATFGCRLTAEETDREEHGGILLVTPDEGDVVAYVRAPDSVARTAVSVRLSGTDLDREVARAMRAHPGTKIGYYHVHLEGPAALSHGDHAQLDALQGNPSFPPCGIVMLLGVKRRGEFTRLRAWIARAKGVVEEMDLREVEDPIAARRNDGARVSVPRVRSHVLATDPGMRRLTTARQALDAPGYAVKAETSPRGAVLRLAPPRGRGAPPPPPARAPAAGTPAWAAPPRRGAVLRLAHPGCKGTLLLTIAPEGWERPPKVELEQGEEGARILLKAPLWAFFGGWSSAYTLGDLVFFLHESKVWPKKAVGLLRKAAGAA